MSIREKLLMKKIKKREKMKKELAQKKGAANLQRQLLKNSEKGECSNITGSLLGTGTLNHVVSSLRRCGQ